MTNELEFPSSVVVTLTITLNDHIRKMEKNDLTYYIGNEIINSFTSEFATIKEIVIA